jgi:hypothetical protein
MIPLAVDRFETSAPRGHFRLAAIQAGDPTLSADTPDERAESADRRDNTADADQDGQQHAVVAPRTAGCHGVGRGVRRRRTGELRGGLGHVGGEYPACVRALSGAL